MSDILRVTTPLVNKTQVIDTRRSVENLTQFNLPDVTKVTRARSDNALLMQNNVLTGEEKTTALLMDLIKDPSVTVTYLRNISLLQEVYSLLPAANRAVTEEIREMFTALLLTPEELTAELWRQEEGSSQFKGQLFDMLRDLLQAQANTARTALSGGEESSGTQLMKYSAMRRAVADLLKALSGYTARRDVLEGLANNLEYLSRSLAPSRALSESLLLLSARFRRPDAQTQFETLKREVLDLLAKVDESILLSPKIRKTASLTVYNLSRFGGDIDFLEAALDRVFDYIPQNEDRERLLGLVMEFIEREPLPKGTEEAAGRSKVLHKLISIIDRQAEDAELLRSTGDRLEKIVQSLLSSPCNFTPLLHYILPMQHMGTQSFMEIWINPNGEEDAPERAALRGDTYHMFMVFDVGDLGRFNMELFVRDKIVDFFLYCPPAFTGAFASAKRDIGRVLGSLGYQFGDVRITDLERERSLMEVFRSLPYKRTGVDVRI